MSSRARVGQAVRDHEWSSARDLAGAVGLTSGTVRKYLYEALRDGRVERRRDLSRPLPRGDGTDVWRWLAEPRVLPPATDEVLCEGCVDSGYDHPLLYRNALSERGAQRRVAMDEQDVAAWDAAELAGLDAPDLRLLAVCDRCRGPLVPED